MSLFRLIRNKDVFGKDYAERLSQRLLWEKTQHEEREKVLVSRFKEECGQPFTQRMETIFEDIEFSKKASSGFKNVVAREFVKKDPSLSVDVEIKLSILTATAWPLAESSKAVKVPAAIVPLLNNFQGIYGK